MQITKVRAYSIVRGTLRSYADVTFDNCICVREFRLLRIQSEYVLCMPHAKEKDGGYRDVAYPADDKTLEMMRKAVMAEYEKIRRQSAARDEDGYPLSSSVPALQRVTLGVVLREQGRNTSLRAINGH